MAALTELFPHCLIGVEFQLLLPHHQLRKFFPRVPLIINDRVDIALAVDADGVHVGQDDLPAKEVRRILGPGTSWRRKRWGPV